MSNTRILVVDDESDIRATLKEVLGDEGFDPAHVLVVAALHLQPDQRAAVVGRDEVPEILRPVRAQELQQGLPDTRLRVRNPLFGRIAAAQLAVHGLDDVGDGVGLTDQA